jgi:hypothetical protein
MHKRCANALFWELYKICHKHYAEDPEGIDGEPRLLKFDNQCAAVQVIASAPMAQDALRAVDLPDNFPRLREQNEPEGEWALLALIGLLEMVPTEAPVQIQTPHHEPTMDLGEMKQALTIGAPHAPSNAYQEQPDRYMVARALAHVLWRLWLDLSDDLEEMGEKTYTVAKGASIFMEQVEDFDGEM